MADPSSVRGRASGSFASHPALVILAVSVVLVAITAFVIGRDVVGWYRGMSYDFPYYVWRTNLVSATGLRSLASPTLADTVVNLDRPGFAVVTSLVGSTVRIDPVALVRAIQVATTLAISLAVGAFALDILEEPRWSLPVYVLVTGVSAQVARTSIGSLDNLLVDAVLVAVAVAAIGSTERGRGRAAAVAGLAAAALIHWFFTILFLILLGAVAIVLIPWSIGARRRGTPALETPAAAMGIIVAGGTIASAAALLALAPGIPPELPPTQGNKGNLTRLPYFRLPFTGALAALGALNLWRPETRKRRIGLVLLVLWGMSVVVAQLVSLIAADPIKVFRVAGFDLAIPMLGAAALVGVVRLGGRLGVAGRLVAFAALVTGVATLVSIGVAIYRTPSPDRTASQLDEVRSVARYIQTIPEGRPVVFLSTLTNPRLADRVVLAGLPGDRIERTYLYAGEASDLLAGRAGLQDGNERQAQAAEEWWEEAWGNADEILRADPVIVYLRGFNRKAMPPPVGAETLAPGVLVLNGPTVTAPVTPAPLSTSSGALALQVLGVFLLLGLVGSGWARWLPVGPAGWWALSPAVGIAALALLGTAVGKVGGPSGGAGGLAVLIAVAALGWLLLLIRPKGRHERHHDRVGPRPPYAAGS